MYVKTHSAGAHPRVCPRAGLLCMPLLACLLAFFISACTSDAYEKGDGEYSTMEAEMAEIHVDSTLQADLFVTDNGEAFTIANPFKTGWMKTPDSIYRAVTYFSRNTAGQAVSSAQGSGRTLAEVKGLNRVGVAVPRKIKDMKTDPVHFESLWLSNNRKYLNLCIYLLLGSTNDEEAVQKLGCLNDTLVVNNDGTTSQHLTLYHDQGGVPEYYSQRTYVSIPLNDIKADFIILSIRTYNGGTERKIIQL